MRSPYPLTKKVNTMSQSIDSKQNEYLTTQVTPLLDDGFWETISRAWDKPTLRFHVSGDVYTPDERRFTETQWSHDRRRVARVMWSIVGVLRIALHLPPAMPIDVVFAIERRSVVLRTGKYAPIVIASTFQNIEEPDDTEDKKTPYDMHNISLKPKDVIDRRVRRAITDVLWRDLSRTVAGTEVTVTQPTDSLDMIQDGLGDIASASIKRELAFAAWDILTIIRMEYNIPADKPVKVVFMPRPLAVYVHIDSGLPIYSVLC